MTEIMPVPRNLNFTVLPAESFTADFFNISPIFTAGSAASALQINAVQQVSARGGAEHAPAEILDGGA